MYSSDQPAVGQPGGIASFERPIDLVHLARQTLGDRALEQEILSLYVKQARSLLSRIGECGCGRDRADMAHTLKGSSRAVGAWQVALASEAVEIVPPGRDAEFAAALKALSTCVEAACDTISELQRAH